jgi:peptide deformylase
MDHNMTVRPIDLFGHPALRTKSEPVSHDDTELTENIADLSDTLADFKRRTTWGRGIAANQIGITKRLIVLNLGSGPQVIINPEIVWTSDDQQEIWDDCFSLPDVLVRLRRPRSISLTYQDERFFPRAMEKLDASMTELLHHEVDHLDGVLMIDRMFDQRLIVARQMRAEADRMLPEIARRKS